MNEELLWAWAAGIVDGEGSFYIAKVTREGFNPTLAVAMTHHATIKKLETIFKCGAVGIVRSVSDKHKDSFYIHVTGKRVFEVCNRLLPYLITKKRQAELMIEYGEKCYTERGTFGVGRGKAPIELVADREIIRDELRELNKRGRVAVAARPFGGFMLTPEIKEQIIRWICSPEPKSICESLDLEIDLEEDIDMFLLECQTKLLGGDDEEVDNHPDGDRDGGRSGHHEHGDGPSGQCPEAPGQARATPSGIPSDGRGYPRLASPGEEAGG